MPWTRFVQWLVSDTAARRSLAEEHVYYPFLRDAEVLCAVRVWTDAMAPTLRTGDIAFLSPYLDDRTPYDAVVVGQAQTGELLIGRLMRHGDARYIRPINSGLPVRGADAPAMTVLATVTAASVRL